MCPQQKLQQFDNAKPIDAAQEKFPVPSQIQTIKDADKIFEPEQTEELSAS